MLQQEVVMLDHVVIEIGSHSQGTSRNFSQVDSSQTITNGVGNSLIMPQEVGVPQGDQDSESPKAKLTVAKVSRHDSWNV